MKRNKLPVRLAAAFLLLLLPAFSAAAVTAILEEADQLFEEEKYVQGFDLLQASLGSAVTDGDKGEIYWRLAKFQLNIADDMKDAGADSATLLALYDQGSKYAEQAMDAAPSADAYYWHSSNIGRWGETKGILDSLFKAGPMRDDLLKVIEFDPAYADAWYVFGRLYLLLPGWPLSFGNVPFAVSFARRAIDLYEEEELKISYYKSLAEVLWKRNWNAANRSKEIGNRQSKLKSARNEHDRQAYFESALGADYVPDYAGKALKEMSDREEARMIVDWLLKEYQKIPSPDKGDIRNIDEVKEMAAAW